MVMPASRARAVLIGLCTVVACHTGAQFPAVLEPAVRSLLVPPTRPGILPQAGDTASIDTNDARVYFAAGMAYSSHFTPPRAANAAFYWASRVDPSWSQPLYQRWSLLRFYARTPATRDEIDPLVVAAFERDPFFRDNLYLRQKATAESLAVTTAVAEARCVNRRDPIVIIPLPALGELHCDEPGAWNAYLELRQCADPGAQTCPWPVGSVYDRSKLWYVAYGDTNYALASRLLARRIKASPDSMAYYYRRAKAQFFLSQYDSATATLRGAITRMERPASNATRGSFFTPAEFAYAIGIIRQTQGQDSAARAAFQESVRLDPGLVMSHLHLAAVALSASDTATAIAEGRLAAAARPDDPVVQLMLGYTLLTAGHTADAATHLDAAVAADSAYALPYLYLGEARLLQHDTTGTAAALDGFLSRARRDDTHRLTVSAQLAALGGVPNPARRSANP
jgi:tetratricopeptide (TPR) repeat protein